MDDAHDGELLTGTKIIMYSVLRGRSGNLSNMRQKLRKDAVMIRAKDQEPIAHALLRMRISGHFGRLPVTANGTP
jgi:hypothetical protein